MIVTRPVSSTTDDRWAQTDALDALCSSLSIARAAFEAGRLSVAREIATAVYAQARRALLPDVAVRAACVLAWTELRDGQPNAAREWSQQARGACPVARSGPWSAVATMLLAHTYRASGPAEIADRLTVEAARLAIAATTEPVDHDGAVALDWLRRLVAVADIATPS